jgi:hypothetical protein
MTEGQEYMRSVGNCGSAGLLLPTVIAHDATITASASKKTTRAIFFSMTAIPDFTGTIADGFRRGNTSLIFG